MRTEDEVRRELDRLAQHTKGSYEELAGAEAALRWVLGEGEPVIPSEEAAA